MASIETLNLDSIKMENPYLRLGTDVSTLEKSIINLNRQFLHAKSIGFMHPKNNKKMIFNSTLPHELNIILKKLKNTRK